jgi:hypothetical protein
MPEEISRALTPEEVRTKLLTQIALMADYWATTVPPATTTLERTHGLAFSILVILDGESPALPAFDLSPAPCPGDKAYFESRGRPWFEAIPVNSSHSLHEEYTALTNNGRSR